MDLENLLKEKEFISSYEANKPVKCEPGTAKKMLRADKSASLADFIEMVGLIVEHALEDVKVDFMPDENQKNFIDPDVAFNRPVITYKIIHRKPKNELKPMPREEVIENCDGQDRVGMVYGIRYDCQVQFNIFASEYKLANKVMDKFEELMLSYAGYIKQNGVVDFFFTDQYTDSEYNTFRETMSVRNLEYYVEIEKLVVIFNEKVKDVLMFGDVKQQ